MALYELEGDMVINEVDDVTDAYEIDDGLDDVELCIHNSVTGYNEEDEDMMNREHQAYLEELYGVNYGMMPRMEITLNADGSVEVNEGYVNVFDNDDDNDNDNDNDDDNDNDNDNDDDEYSAFVNNDNETIEAIGQDKYDSSNKYKLYLF